MTAPSEVGNFVLPPYPYDRVLPALRRAEAHDGGAVDLSIGTPNDPPSHAVLEALGRSDAGGALRSYPSSPGSPALRDAISAWTLERSGLDVPADSLAACIGTKEFVASTASYMKLRNPRCDTVLYPAVSYPTYAMGATLAGLRSVAVPVDEHWAIDLSAVSDADAARTLLLWVNSPGNPAGGLDDLAAAAAWGRERGIPVFSDECYAEFTWDADRHTILEDGLDGVVAVHSLSKTANLAGLRVGWYAGDAEIVAFLREIRKHVGLMVPGPAQLAAIAALCDPGHIVIQRERYLARLVRMREILMAVGVEASLPSGGFYLWVRAPDGDAWGFTEHLAATAGLLVSPGELYGPAGAEYVRLAMVQPLERLELVASRLGL